jgi:hypothetical protein
MRTVNNRGVPSPGAIEIRLRPCQRATQLVIGKGRDLVLGIFLPHQLAVIETNTECTHVKFGGRKTGLATRLAIGTFSY